MQGLTRWFPNFLVALAFHASVTGPSCISAGRTFMKPHIPLMTSTVSSRLLLCVVESALTHLIHIILSRRILDFLQCSSACISKATFPALLKARGTSCLSFGQWDGSGSGFQGSPFHSLFFLPAARKTALMTGAPAATRGQRQLWGLNGGTEKRGRVWAQGTTTHQTSPGLPTSRLLLGERKVSLYKFKSLSLDFILLYARKLSQIYLQTLHSFSLSL